MFVSRVCKGWFAGIHYSIAQMYRTSSSVTAGLVPASLVYVVLPEAVSAHAGVLCASVHEQKDLIF